MLLILSEVSSRDTQVIGRVLNYVTTLLPNTVLYFLSLIILPFLPPSLPLLYSDMDETSFTMMASLISVKSYAAEEVIYCKGADSNYIFIVAKGRVQVSE